MCSTILRASRPSVKQAARAYLPKYRRIDDPTLKVELDRIGPLKSATVSIEQMAAKADLTTLYLSAYPVLSDTVHAGIRDLETRHVETGNGDIVTLKNEPAVDGLEVLLLMTTAFLIAALEGFASILKLDLGDFCERSKGTLKALADAGSS
ncbi:MAG TPA: DUF5677 domain-containing protein [Vicinamibacterales bacterium]|nr:DUF5677 domain-containing protein [Vicinamibacterales bacterium]